MPLDPTVSYGGIWIHVAATGTFPLVFMEGCILPHDNSHFEEHSWFHHLGEFRAVDHLAIFGTQNLVVTPFHEAIS